MGGVGLEDDSRQGESPSAEAEPAILVCLGCSLTQNEPLICQLGQVIMELAGSSAQ